MIDLNKPNIEVFTFVDGYKAGGLNIQGRPQGTALFRSETDGTICFTWMNIEMVCKYNPQPLVTFLARIKLSIY